MTTDDSCLSEQLSNLLNFKCEKCKKRVKNGVQCAACDGNYHKKCGNIVESEEDVRWTCGSCGDKSTPFSLLEIKCQTIERAYLLLQGECNAYKVLYNEMEEKCLTLKRELNNLKELKQSNTKNSVGANQNANQNVQKTKRQNSVQEKNIKSKDHQQIASANKNETNKIQVETNYSNIHQNSPQTSAKKSATNYVSEQNSKDKLPCKTMAEVTVLDSDSKTADYEIPKYHKIKPKNNPQSIVGINNNDILKANPQVGWLHVYRLSEDTTKEQLLNYLEKTKPNKKFQCEKLQSRGNYASFKVGFPMSIKEEIYSPDFWPAEIRVRRFFLKRQQ